MAAGHTAQPLLHRPTSLSGVGQEQQQCWFAEVDHRGSSLETQHLRGHRRQPRAPCCKGCAPHPTPWLSLMCIQQSSHPSGGTHHHPEADITTTSSGQGSRACSQCGLQSPPLEV